MTQWKSRPRGMLLDDAKLDLLIELDRKRWRRQLVSANRELEVALRALAIPDKQKYLVKNALDAHTRRIWEIASAKK